MVYSTGESVFGESQKAGGSFGAQSHPAEISPHFRATLDSDRQHGHCLGVGVLACLQIDIGLKS